MTVRSSSPKNHEMTRRAERQPTTSAHRPPRLVQEAVTFDNCSRPPAAAVVAAAVVLGASYCCCPLRVRCWLRRGRRLRAACTVYCLAGCSTVYCSYSCAYCLLPRPPPPPRSKYCSCTVLLQRPAAPPTSTTSHSTTKQAKNSRIK